MDCHGCLSSRKSFYCERCIGQGLSSHSSATSLLNTQLSLSRSRCERILLGPSTTPKSSEADLGTAIRSTRRRRGLDMERVLRADVWELSVKKAKLVFEVERKGREVEKRKGELRKRKEEVVRRRKLLKDGEGRLESTIKTLSNNLSSLRAGTTDVHARLAMARKILVDEAIGVFDVREVTQMRSGKKRKGDEERWMIAGLEIGGPRSFGAYSSVHVNAVLQHTIHLLALLTSYLGLSLPFSPFWAPDHSSVSAEVASLVLATKRPSLEDKVLMHVGKLFLSGKENSPFLRTALRRRIDPDESKAGSTPSSTDSGAGGLDDLFDGKPRMLYVSSGRERWRKAEAEKHRSTPRMKETRSTVLVEKPKKGEENPRPTSKLRDQIVVEKPRDEDQPSPRKDKRTKKEEQLVDAFTMLVCDLMYVAKTQGVDLDEGTGEVGLILKWLDMLKNASRLGEVSHQSAHRTLHSIDLPIDMTILNQTLKAKFSDDQALQQRDRRVTEGHASPVRVEELEEWSMI